VCDPVENFRINIRIKIKNLLIIIFKKLLYILVVIKWSLINTLICIMIAFV
jgi:hypothetical protein